MFYPQQTIIQSLLGSGEEIKLNEILQKHLESVSG